MKTHKSRTPMFLQVFDLTTLRGLDADSTRSFTTHAWYGGVSNTHNIAANPDSNTVFLVGCTRSPGNECRGGKATFPCQ